MGGNRTEPLEKLVQNNCKWVFYLELVVNLFQLNRSCLGTRGNFQKTKKHKGQKRNKEAKKVEQNLQQDTQPFPNYKKCNQRKEKKNQETQKQQKYILVPKEQKKKITAKKRNKRTQAQTKGVAMIWYACKICRIKRPLMRLLYRWSLTCDTEVIYCVYSVAIKHRTQQLIKTLVQKEK